MGSLADLRLGCRQLLLLLLQGLLGFGQRSLGALQLAFRQLGLR